VTGRPRWDAVSTEEEALGAKKSRSGPQPPSEPPPSWPPPSEPELPEPESPEPLEPEDVVVVVVVVVVELEPSPGPELDPEEPPSEELSEPSTPEPVEVLPPPPSLPPDVGWATGVASSEPSLPLPDELPISPEPEPDSPEPLPRFRECWPSELRASRRPRSSPVVAATAADLVAAAWCT
jgi:hypothetical protein